MSADRDTHLVQAGMLSDTHRMVGRLICRRTICVRWHGADWRRHGHPNLCRSGPTGAYHRVFRITGGTVAAIFLSRMVLVAEDRRRPRWLVLWTLKRIGKEAGLSKRERRLPGRLLRDAGILLGIAVECRRCSGSVLIGTRRGLFGTYQVACTDKNGGMRHTGMAESANQDYTIPPFIQTEITTETTTESDGRLGVLHASGPTTRLSPTMHFLPHPIFDDWQPDRALIREIEREGLPCGHRKTGAAIRRPPPQQGHGARRLAIRVSEMDAGCQGVWAHWPECETTTGARQEREGVRPNGRRFLGWH